MIRLPERGAAHFEAAWRPESGWQWHMLDVATGKALAEQPRESHAIMMAAPFLILLGFAALCLGMEKHYKEYFGRAPTSQRQRGLRALGWLSLALSFVACVAGDGWQIGPLLWFGWLSVLGMVLVFARPWFRGRRTVSQRRAAPVGIGLRSSVPFSQRCFFTFLLSLKEIHP